MRSESLKKIATILVSAWFFPVSCSVVTFGGAPVLEALDARKVASGDTVHDSAIIVHTKGEPGRPFGFSQVRRHIPDNARLLMPVKENFIEWTRESGMSYKVLKDDTDSQIIEAASWGEWATVTHVYEARASGFQSISSRETKLNVSFLLGIGVAFLLAVIGYVLKALLLVIK